jgi:hypothetical protein
MSEPEEITTSSISAKKGVSSWSLRELAVGVTSRRAGLSLEGDARTFILYFDTILCFAEGPVVSTHRENTKSSHFTYFYACEI